MRSTLRRFVVVGSVAALALTATVAPAAAAPTPVIRSVEFSGIAGSGQSSPTVTITGKQFGAAPRGGTPANACGDNGPNGFNFGSTVYFSANRKFGAGYSDATVANCVGIDIVSWTGSQIVLTFGAASYGQFFKYDLENGNGYAVSVKGAIFGAKVRGLT